MHPVRKPDGSPGWLPAIIRPADRPERPNVPSGVLFVLAGVCTLFSGGGWAVLQVTGMTSVVGVTLLGVGLLAGTSLLALGASQLLPPRLSPYLEALLAVLALLSLPGMAMIGLSLIYRLLLP